MTPGLSSAVFCAVLPSTGAVIQSALFVEDTEARIADLEKRLVESEAAYMRACEDIAVFERECATLRQVNTTLSQRIALLERSRDVIAHAAFSAFWRGRA